MATSAQRRLLKDLKRIQNEAGDEIIASPSGESLLRWTAAIEGIEQTPWEGGIFQLRLDFSENYPNKAPLVRFTTRMFHPNIYNDGRICLDMLQNQWSPVYDVWSILTAVRLLLADPNTLSPANCIASRMFKENKTQYEMKVRELVEKSLEGEPEEEEDEKEKGEGEEEGALEAENLTVGRRRDGDRRARRTPNFNYQSTPIRNSEQEIDSGALSPIRPNSSLFDRDFRSPAYLPAYRRNFMQVSIPNYALLSPFLSNNANSVVSAEGVGLEEGEHQEEDEDVPEDYSEEEQNAQSLYSHEESH